MNEKILMAFLVLMIAFSAFQSLQLMEFKGTPTGELVAIGNLDSSSPQKVQKKVDVPSSLQNLPGMVGGC
jgi:hypothetical protein